MQSSSFFVPKWILLAKSIKWGMANLKDLGSIFLLCIFDPYDPILNFAPSQPLTCWERRFLKLLKSRNEQYRNLLKGEKSADSAVLADFESSISREIFIETYQTIPFSRSVFWALSIGTVYICIWDTLKKNIFQAMRGLTTEF